MSEKKEKKSNKGKLAAGALLLLLLGGGMGFGLGGNGFGLGLNSSQQDASKEESEESASKPEEETLDAITVTVRENKVLVGDKEFDNAEALKAYIEEINTDGKEFVLKEENSILDTHDWTIKVFEELKIELLKED